MFLPPRSFPCLLKSSPLRLFCVLLPCFAKNPQTQTELVICIMLCQEGVSQTYRILESDSAHCSKSRENKDSDLRVGSEKWQPSAPAGLANKSEFTAKSGRQACLAGLSNSSTTIHSKKYLSYGDLVRRQKHTYVNN